jgi:hypothetical protein
MSDDAKQLSTRQQANTILSQIVGLPLTAARRAADMRTLQFGSLCPVGGGSVGDFALHIQCPWRIEGPNGIVTGRLDLWEPVEEDIKIDYETWDYDESPNLQDFRLDQLLAQNGLSLVVQSVDTDEFGGANITFDHGFVLRLFPAGTRGEDWRLFEPKTDNPHFVIVEGKIET